MNRPLASGPVGLIVATSNVSNTGRVAGDCAKIAQAATREASKAALRENIHPHHPPDKEKGNDRHDEVFDPLDGGSWFRAVFHVGVRAVWGPVGFIFDRSFFGMVHHDELHRTATVKAGPLPLARLRSSRPARCGGS